MGDVHGNTAKPSFLLLSPSPDWMHEGPWRGLPPTPFMTVSHFPLTSHRGH